MKVHKFILFSDAARIALCVYYTNGDQMQSYIIRAHLNW